MAPLIARYVGFALVAFFCVWMLVGFITLVILATPVCR